MSFVTQRTTRTCSSVWCIGVRLWTKVMEQSIRQLTTLTKNTARNSSRPRWTTPIRMLQITVTLIMFMTTSRSGSGAREQSPYHVARRYGVVFTSQEYIMHMRSFVITLLTRQLMPHYSPHPSLLTSPLTTHLTSHYAPHLSLRTTPHLIPHPSLHTSPLTMHHPSPHPSLLTSPLTTHLTSHYTPHPQFTTYLTPCYSPHPSLLTTVTSNPHSLLTFASLICYMQKFPATSSPSQRMKGVGAVKEADAKKKPSARGVLAGAQS